MTLIAFENKSPSVPLYEREKGALPFGKGALRGFALQ